MWKRFTFAIAFCPFLLESPVLAAFGDAATQSTVKTPAGPCDTLDLSGIPKRPVDGEHLKACRKFTNSAQGTGTTFRQLCGKNSLSTAQKEVLGCPQTVGVYVPSTDLASCMANCLNVFPVGENSSWGRDCFASCKGRFK